MADGPLDAAVLLEGPAITNWAASALERAVDAGDLAITRVVINDAVAASVAPGNRIERFRRYLRTARQYGAWAPISMLHSVVNPPAYLRTRPLNEHGAWLADADRIHCAPEPAAGLGNELPGPVVDEIAANADVVFRFGFGILKGDILTATEHGVLSFHHADIRRYRGSPTHVWEFLHDETESGVTLQQLTETLDGGRIVGFEPVDIHDARTWQEIKRRKFHTSVGMIATAVRNLQDPSFSPTAVDDLGELYTTPSTTETLRIVAKNTRQRLFGRS